MMAFTLDAGVFGAVLQERWDKAKGSISVLWNGIFNQGGCYKSSTLLSERGFLIYVGCTYPTTHPYLKGLNLTIDWCRPGCDVEGWKDMDRYEDYPIFDSGEVNEEAPEFVMAVPRFWFGTWGL
jgi:hypothetical protein